MLLLDYNEDRSLQVSSDNEEVVKSSNRILNFNTAVESIQGVSAKIQINTLSPFVGFGGGPGLEGVGGEHGVPEGEGGPSGGGADGGHGPPALLHLLALLPLHHPGEEVWRDSGRIKERQGEAK